MADENVAEENKLPWAPMFALPNIRLTAPLGVEGFLLVPPSDFRSKAIAAQQKLFGAFLKQFVTEFGDPVEPSIIIWRNDKPDTYRSIPAISGFRDAISMSVIPLAWARSLRWNRGMGPVYADSFRVYPWMVDKNGEHLITQTPVMLGIHDVNRHKGQSIAALYPQSLDERDIDRQLLTELLKRWQKCFATADQPEEEEHLFRSLNMANAAAMMPAGADSQLYDTAGLLMLWRSAHRYDQWSLLCVSGGLLMGIGGFNLIEGIIMHDVLAAHHVNETAPLSEQFLWDVEFLGWGSAFLALGILLIATCESK